MTLDEWATRWALPPQAIQELRQITGETADTTSSGSEASVMSECQLLAGQLGVITMRNNVGVLEDQKTGRPVRFGLMNDSQKRNEHFKSSDDICIIPYVVKPHDVGRKFGIFGAIEYKKRNWVFTGAGRETPQANFHRMVNAAGGIAFFANSRQCVIDRLVSTGVVSPPLIK